MPHSNGEQKRNIQNTNSLILYAPPNIKDNRIHFVFGSKEFKSNSNLKYDWTNEVNLGMMNQCRFHTVALYKFYFRIFQLNPIKNQEGIWIKDNGVAEIAFRIPKGQGKEK